MTLPDFRLIRLLPLASLVLTACTLPGHEGPGKSPDSPQWRQHQQEVRHLNQYQTRGAFAYISDDQKVYARFFWQQTGQDRYRLLLTNRWAAPSWSLTPSRATSSWWITKASVIPPMTPKR